MAKYKDWAEETHYFETIEDAKKYKKHFAALLRDNPWFFPNAKILEVKKEEKGYLIPIESHGKRFFMNNETRQTVWNYMTIWER